MFTLPNLPYKFDALEPYIDAQTMEIHHGKHHAGYVKNLNDALAGAPESASLSVEQLVGDLSKVPEEMRTKVRNNGGGHYNHSLFWQIMCPAAQSGQPEGRLLEAINSTFTSLDGFKEKFAAAALGRFGSGWVWLVVDGGILTILDTPNQDSPVMEKLTPVLGLDVWEHAYYLKYQNHRATYIQAWWEIVNWPAVVQRFAQATT